MPGVAWDLLPMTRYRAHNWHCFGDLEREPYAAIYTTLGLSVSLLVLLHPGAVQGRRADDGTPSRGQQLSFLVACESRRGDRPARHPVRRAEHQVRRRDVRAESAPRRRYLRPAHRARLRPEHLGVRARGHGEGRHARQAEARRLQLARARHRGRRRPRADRRRQALRGRRGVRHGPPHQGCRHQRHRQLHLRAARGHARDDAANARSGARPQLRVRELLLRDGVSRLAVVRGSDSSWVAAAGRLERLLAAFSGYAAAADTPHPGRRSAELPRSRLRHLLQARTVSEDGQGEIRRGHARAHPRDDVAHVGAGSTRQRRTKKRQTNSYPAVPLESLFVFHFSVFVTPVSSLSLPTRPDTAAAHRARAPTHLSADSSRALRPACAQSAGPNRSACARTPLCPCHPS